MLRMKLVVRETPRTLVFAWHVCKHASDLLRSKCALLQKGRRYVCTRLRRTTAALHGRLWKAMTILTSYDVLKAVSGPGIIGVNKTKIRKTLPNLAYANTGPGARGSRSAQSSCHLSNSNSVFDNTASRPTNTCSLSYF